MITIEPPFYSAFGVTVLRDHTNADLFYVLPPAPRLAAREEGVAFSLLKYRFDLTDAAEREANEAGGGFATMEIDAALPSPKLALLQAEVARLSGRPDARVVPAAFRTALARAIVAHSEGDRLIEDLVQTGAVSPVSPHRAAFALSLSPAGATLLERAAKGESLPVGVVYELAFLALTPSIQATARVDFERAYDRIAASLGVQYQAVRAELDADFAWLVENDVIHIEVTSFTDTEDAQRQRDLVMALIKTRIEQGFFRTSMPAKPQEGMGGAVGNLLSSIVGGDEPTASSALLVLKAKVEVEDELKTLTLTFNGRTAIPLVHVATAFLSAMHDEETPLDVREIDLDDPFFSRFEVSIHSAISFDEMPDLVSAKVDLAYRDHRASYVLARGESGPYVFRAGVTRGEDTEFSYEVDYTFDAAVGAGPLSIHAGPFTSKRRALVVDPAAHFRYRRLRAVLGPLDPALVPRTTLHVRAVGDEGEPDLAAATLLLDETQKEAVFRLRSPMSRTNLRVLVRPEWLDAAGATHVGAEEEARADVLIALGPYKGSLVIHVVPGADWEAVIQVAVQIRYRDGDHTFDKDLLFVPSGGRAAQDVEIPLIDPAKRAYEWRQTVLRLDGTAAEDDWTSSDRSVLVVGGAKKTSGEVRIVLVGAPPETAGVRVDLWATGAQGEEQSAAVFLIPGSASEKVASLPLDAEGRLAYRYEVRRVSAEGEDLVKLGEGDSALLVVHGGG